MHRRSRGHGHAKTSRDKQQLDESTTRNNSQSSQTNRGVIVSRCANLVQKILAIALAICVIGVPIPSSWFYSHVFFAKTGILSTAYRMGLFGFDAVQMCDDSIDSSTAFDVGYYSRLQAELGLDNQAMYDYLQQWICVVPPDEENAYIAAINSFDAEYNEEMFVEHEPYQPAVPAPPKPSSLMWEADSYGAFARDESIISSSPKIR